MIYRRLGYQLFRFCSKQQKIPQPQQLKPRQLIDEQKKSEVQIPVHLKPYNKQKYEVPMKKVKINSGYTMIQIQPFPRARIMKVCYHILVEVKKDIPEDYIFRILTQEKIKWIMSTTDRIQDTEELQIIFGRLPIEIFIRNLANQLEIIKIVRTMKLWNKPEEVLKQEEEEYIKLAGIHPPHRNPHYKKEQRTKVNLM